MTIQLTAPILEAGVEKAVATQLTLSADREAELVNRGVAVYTSRSLAAGEDLVQVLGRRNPAGGLLEFVFEGSSYAAIPLDVNGNLIVTGIVPRKDTLANLLLLTGSQGEIASATDVAAIVKYTGSAPPNNAEVFRKSDVLGSVILSLDADTTVNSGAETNILLGRVVRDDFGASNDGKIHIPTDAAFFDLSLLVFWPDASAGTYRTAILRGTTGVGLNLCSDTFTPNAGNAARPSLLNLSKHDPVMFAITPGTTVLQPRLKHDSGSAQVFSGYSGSVSPGLPAISMSATFYA